MAENIQHAELWKRWASAQALSREAEKIQLRDERLDA